MGTGGHNHVATLEERPRQETLGELQGRQDGVDRAPPALTGLLGVAGGLADVGQVPHAVNLVQAVQEQEDAAGSGLLGQLGKLRPLLVLNRLFQADLSFDGAEDLRHELPAGHGAKPVERPALHEDEDVEVWVPQLVAAPLHAHVLEHGALTDTGRGLDGYDRG